MELQSLIDYCSQKPKAKQEFPFDDTTLVFKVGSKMFALISLNNPHQINLKCDPLLVPELRKKYPAVIPGYHMNKKHWNTVKLDGSIQTKLLRDWIDESYNLIIIGMTKKEKESLGIGN